MAELFTMQRYFFILFLLFFFYQGNGQQAGRSWEMVKDQKGIKVYTSKKSNTPLKRVKVSAIIDAPLGVVYSVLTDVANHHKWMYQVYHSEILKKVNDTAWYYYAISNSPWPVDDRDYVSFTKVKIDSINGNIAVTSRGVPDYIPQMEGIVRLPYSYSQWIFKALDKDHTYAELKIEVDIGGKVPAWLLNMFITRGPYFTMMRFSKQVKEATGYESPSFCQ